MSGMNTGFGMDQGFGAMLTTLRGQLSQDELALRAGTSQSYISRVEKGLIQPTLPKAQRLLHALGYELPLSPRPIRVRSDIHGRPMYLAMTAEERIESAAALANTVAELRGRE
jgi:predicted transcriptional regulator